MADERHPVWRLADQIQMDIRNAQTKLVELRSQLAHLNLDNLPTPQPQPACDYCGVTTTHGHAADCEHAA